MKLKKILKNIEIIDIKGSKDIEITGVCGDSKCVFPGNLFVARKGKNFDASEFIPEAILAGAVAIITDLYDPFLQNVVQVIHNDPGEIEAEIAANYYAYPSKELHMIGVTGTNGKTTTSYLIKHIFDASEKKCGLLGSIEYITGDHRQLSVRTTPDTITNQKFLRDMLNHNCKTCVMEVSSHGLEQERTKHIDFDVGVFTNLTQDHLDYHETMDKYLLAKKKLFLQMRKDQWAVINKDSVYYEKISGAIPPQIFSYSVDNQADLQARHLRLSLTGSHFDLFYQDKEYNFFSPLIGKFNVYNLLAAISVGIVSKIPIEIVISSLSSFNQISGRLERVMIKKPYHVFVDFSHTPDALENVLKTLCGFKKGKIITVFGCGGNRDYIKRSLMAKVSEKYADLSIITNDNPRKEDPQNIAKEIISGFSDYATYKVILDRKQAINSALSLAGKDDIILIAGKGHEKTQIFHTMTVDFNDVVCVKELS